MGPWRATPPIRVALELGATRMIVLPSGYACALELRRAARSPRCCTRSRCMIAHQLVVDLERCGGQGEIVTVPPLCPLAVSPYDFSQRRRADRAAQREQTRRVAAARRTREAPHPGRAASARRLTAGQKEKNGRMSASRAGVSRRFTKRYTNMNAVCSERTHLF
jgi:hypothetical protein